MRYEIIDGGIQAGEIERMYDFVLHSNFNVGWVDSPEEISGLFRNMASHYSDDDIRRLEFFENITSQKLLDKIDGRWPTKTTINLSYPGNVYYPHTHQREESMVYYANVRWLPEWAGETMIFNDDMTVDTAIEFKSGRVLWMDEGVPHSLRAPSTACPDFRFTMAMFFEKKNS